MKKVLLGLDSSWRYLAFRMALRFLNLRDFVQHLESRRFMRHQLSPAQREFLSWWLTAISSRTSRNPCLLHALVLFSMDRDARFILGVSTQDGFQSHAWVESANQVYSTVQDVSCYGPIWQWDGSCTSNSI